ncbi:MAG: PD40 domain-containing protein [Acidobacteria bacterium]|nr:PD40 domain-containing protein [Acidobacteriota bacterium]
MNDLNLDKLENWPALRLDVFTFEAARNRISGPEKETILEPRVARTLAALCAEWPQTVSRQALLDLVWGETAVTEDSLTRAVSDLRKILVDGPDQPKIETVRKVGYRLLLEPRIVNEESPTTSTDRSTQEDEVLLQDQSRPPAAAIWRWLTPVLLLSFLTMVWLIRPPASSIAQIRDFSPARQITWNKGRERFGTLSPGGNLVAFIATTQDTDDIYVQSIDGGNPLRLTQDGQKKARLTFSQDGNRLYFYRQAPDSHQIVQVPALGGQEKVVWQGDTPIFGLAERGSTQTLFFTVMNDARNRLQIKTLELESGMVQAFPERNSGAIGDCGLQVSPNGKHLLVLRYETPCTRELLAIQIETGIEHQLANSGQLVTDACWMDDEHVITGAELTSPLPFSVLGFDGSSRILPLRETQIAQPAFAAGTLLAVHHSFDSDIVACELPTAPTQHLQKKILSPSSGMDCDGAWSPDGKRVAYLSDRDHNRQIWIQEEEGAATCFSDFKNAKPISPVWSQDGTQLAWILVEGGMSSIWTSPVSQFQPKRIAERVGLGRLSCWTADNNGLIVSLMDQDHYQLYEMDLTGALRRLTENGGFKGVYAQDGSLYFSKHPEHGLFRLFEGREELVLKDLCLMSFFDVEGDFLIYGDENWQLTRRNLNTNEIETLGGIGPSMFIPANLDIAPGGQKFLLESMAYWQSDILAYQFEESNRI